MQSSHKVFWINNTNFCLPFMVDWWDDIPVLSFSHKLKVNNCPKSLEPLLKALNGFDCLHTAGGKTSGPFLLGLVSEEDTLRANQSLLQYCISPSQIPPPILTLYPTGTNFLKFCLPCTKSLKIQENRKERSPTDRASKLLSLSVLGKQAEIMKLGLCWRYLGTQIFWSASSL